MGKVAFITGATSGIGAAFAKKLAAGGYDLVMTGRRERVIDELAEGLSAKHSVRTEVLIAELSDRENIGRVADKIRGMERLDVLVNNAGYGIRNAFVDEDEKRQESLATVLTLAPMALTHAALPGMIKRGSGSVINVSSIRAFLLAPTSVTYSASKSFLKSFTQALSLELSGTGVHVQVLCPGATHTDFHARQGLDKPLGMKQGLLPWMTAEDVVEESLKCLAKGKVVCIPGFRNKLLSRIPFIIPFPVYAKIFSKANKK